MAADERWYFTREELNNSPSRRCGIDAEKELSYRQQAAHYIQDMGQRLQVNQLAINTAIVYMHRFYMYHSFTRFHRNAIAPAVLFLAAKVEEQPRKLEHVIKVAYHCLNRDQPALDIQSEIYLEKAQELVVNENILLQTLGFDVAIDHPHSHVVKCCQLVRATKDLAQTSYFMATSSLHMTTMCLQYKPTVVACVCIYIVCTWSHYEIQSVSEGKDWFWYVDRTVTHELLETLTKEFLAILDKFPSRLKKVMNATQHSEDRQKSSQAVSSSTGSSRSSLGVGSTSSAVSSRSSHEHNSHAKPGVKGQPPQSHQHQQPQKYNLREYNEKREKERREREKMRDRELIDPREGKQFTLVAAPAHAPHPQAPAAVQSLTGHGLHTSLPPMRSKSSKSSSGMGRNSHPGEAMKTSSSNHKTHGSHSVSQSSRESQQTSADPLRIPSDASRSDQRREAVHNDSERYDKSSRTSSSMASSNSVVDNRLAVHDSKLSQSAMRHKAAFAKPSRQSTEAVGDRKSAIKVEQKVDHKVPEIKPEPVKVKSEIKTEIKSETKEDVKPQYNTIFSNSEIPDFSLTDFLDSSFLNLSEGPPEDLFDNSDSETRPDMSGIIDKNLVPQTMHAKLNKSPHWRMTKSPQSSNEQQQTGDRGQLPVSHAPAVKAEAVKAEQRVTESSSIGVSNYHNTQHHHSASNGSVPAPQPSQGLPSQQQQSKSSSSSSRKSRESDRRNSERSEVDSVSTANRPEKTESSKKSRDNERRNSERSDGELIPLVTKLEDTKYFNAVNESASSVKVRGSEQAGLAAGRADATGAAAVSSGLNSTPAAITTASATTTTTTSASVVAPTVTATPAVMTATNAPITSQNTTSKALPVQQPVPTAPPSDQAQWKNSQPQAPNVKRPRVEHVKEPEAEHSGKNKKYEHQTHKRKEKKKHKHKEKDKTKDREHKEHKEHKKDKKHKKRKDKDKDKDRERAGRGGDEVGGSAPIIITIAKDKVLSYTPEPANAPLRVNTTTAAASLPGNTPSIPKFKIKKARLKPDLFGSASSSPESSSPARDVNKEKDTPNTSLKIRISRDRICSDKESKKRRRDISPGGELRPSKASRNGSEARSSHASPQVGGGQCRPANVVSAAAAAAAPQQGQYPQRQQQQQRQLPMHQHHPHQHHPHHLHQHPHPDPQHPSPQTLSSKKSKFSRAPHPQSLPGPHPPHPRPSSHRHPLPPPSAPSSQHLVGMMPMQAGPYPYQQFFSGYPPIHPPNFNFPPPPYPHPPPPGPGMPHHHAPHEHPMPPYLHAPPPAYQPPPPSDASNPPLPSEPPPPTPPPPPPE